MANSPSPIYKTIHDTATKFIDCYTQATDQKDPSLLSSTLSPKCKRYLAAKSFIKALGTPNSGFSNKEYEERMRGELSMLESARVELHRIIVDELKKSVATFSDHYLKLKGAEEEFCLEFVHLLEMNETGDQVEEIVEFIDTKECFRFMQVMMGS